MKSFWDYYKISIDGAVLGTHFLASVLSDEISRLPHSFDDQANQEASNVSAKPVFPFDVDQSGEASKQQKHDSPQQVTRFERLLHFWATFLDFGLFLKKASGAAIPFGPNCLENLGQLCPLVI